MATKVADAALQEVCKGNQKFTFDIYRVLSEEKGNLIFSPLSVQVILALAHFGAKGKTAKEIAEGLHLPSDKKIIENGFNALMNHLKGSGDTILEVANKIFAQATFPIKEEFKASAEKFLAGAEELDFVQETEKSRAKINNWVENKTNKKITNLIPAGTLNALTRLVLVNAIYFKGKWNIPFSKQATSRMPFHITATETKDVDMMSLKKKFMYTEVDELQAQVLELPYKGDQLSMLIFLPRKIDGLSELETKLAKVKIDDIMKKMQKVEVDIHLPKFKLEYNINLNDCLKRLGLKCMFDDSKADFTGINESTGLVVSHVFHKAFIEVNEEGTEAAAATGMIAMVMSLPPPPVVFKANHPFMFFLKDDISGILFLGHFIAP